MSTQRPGEIHTRRRHPDWIRAKLMQSAVSGSVRNALDSNRLHTICEEARCPNRGECWDAGTATFLILGDICTRSCAYCSVGHGLPGPPDDTEPAGVAAAVRALGNRYVVITSVTRDDLQDGGASQFAAVIQELRKVVPAVGIEILTPDFGGNWDALAVAAEAHPDVFGHNLEVVRRLFPALRPQGDYDRSLALIAHLKEHWPGMAVKSGIMAGLGETREEISQAIGDLRAAGCDMVTVGQYLQPSKHSAPVDRYLHPDEFEEIRIEALGIGFESAVCGPLVRSSYKAEESAKNCKAGCGSNPKT